MAIRHEFAASFGQRRLWFLDQLEPGSASYNVPQATRITGPLDLDIVERSLAAIVRRHEALRTQFASRDGEPVQVVGSDDAVVLRRCDLSAASAERREAEAHRLLLEEAHQPFDLVTGPLIRALAVCLGPDHHILLLTLHHIVCDGWSLGILLRELSHHYNAYASGRPPALAPLDIQYADYAVWQRDTLKGAELETQLSYWREQLRGAPPELLLQADRIQPADRTSDGAILPVAFPRHVSDRLGTLARRERATLFMTLLAAFQTLLMRYTGQEDLTVGSPIAGRNRPEVESLIGFFVNTLVLRTSLGGDPTFRELIGRVRVVTLGAYSYQDLPFERLIEELRPGRSTAHMPFCQATFVLHNTERPTLSIDGTIAVPYPIPSSTAKFDISLSLRDGPDGLRGKFEYRTDLFEPETIARLATHFERVLEGICTNPDGRLSRIPLLTDNERQQILVEWNATKSPYPRNDSTTRIFEDQVRRAPDAVAIACGGATITYAQLNGRANQLSRALRERGIGRGSRVGVCLERSIDQVVGVLGALKAGAAYLPLDPDDPPDRLRFAIQDAGASPILVHSRTASRLTPIAGSNTFALDTEHESFAGQPADNLDGGPQADDHAYVMYTSGSTGVPKAVTILHRGIVRLVKGTSYVSLAANDRVLNSAPLSFDASTFEIWGALLNGGTIIQVPVEQPSLSDLGDVLERNHVTIAWFTSAVFSQMVDHELDRLCHVRQVLAGGDVLSVPHVRRFLAAATQSTLINGYGPTENTTFTCCHPMTHDDVIAVSVPIGRPISNTQVFVLDPHLNAQPVGIPGELYAAGDGLAAGYWNRPELTAERFLPHPFEPGERVYRTGDRARYRADGSLEFLGRLDHQIKIRGFRVELGEIEAVLGVHPAVSEAAVIVEEDARGDKHLAAFIAAAGAPVEVSDLRQAVSRQLPDYMVPTAFTILSALPKTAAGKVDRRLLHTESGRPDAADHKAAEPRTGSENLIARIWREVLGIDRVGLHDDFFELGGHSLLATQVVARIRSQCGVTLPLRALFDAPTVAGLAARLDLNQPADGEGLVALHPRGFKTPFFCVHGIAGEVQLYAELARLLDPNRPFYGLRAPRWSPGQRFPTVEELASGHLIDVRRVVPKGPYLLGGYSAGSTIAYEMAQQLVEDGERVTLVVAMDSTLPNLKRSGSASARAWLESVANLYWWIADDLMEADWREIAARFRSKSTVLAGRLGKVPGFGWTRPKRATDVRDALGIPWVPAEWAPLLEQHYASLKRYRPRPYSGRIALLKARTRPLLRVSEPDLGWNEMARGGVDVRVVRGSHSNLLRPPHVHLLAKALRESLDAADQAAPSDRR